MGGTVSEMETYRGKLTPVDLEGLGLDNWIQNLLGWESLEGTFYESWLEALDEERYDSYVYHKKSEILYEVHRESLDPYGFQFSERKPDGTVEFFVSYYNGGASFDEVAESFLDKS